MKPFAPFEGKKGESRGYYEVPIEILESADDVVKWGVRSTTHAATNPEAAGNSNHQTQG